MAGQGAQRRNNVKKAQAKQAAKKANKKLEKLLASLPKIYEDDLLNFQYAHFGDDSRPEEWFVDAETALNYEPEYDDGLGYYPDGVKRTLTDANIQFFRELEQRQILEKEQRKAEMAEDNTTPSQALQREKEIPYEERNKRRWEKFIQAADPVEGSLTHRRMARELDNQKTESVEMDY